MIWTEYQPEADYEEARALAREAAAALLARIDRPRVDALFVMGSGWKEAASGLGDAIATFPMATLPGFIAPAAAGHGGDVAVVERPEGTALIFHGRTHLYEGYGPLAVAHGVRTAIAAGARVVVLTNACGSMNGDLAVGHPALIRDHINFTGKMPLVGGRFVDLTDIYSPALRAAVKTFDPAIGEGVYAGWYGPAFETPAEIHMMHRLGADLVGMSTVLEAIAAREGGADVLALSLVTNRAAGLSGEKLSGAEVLEVAQGAIPRLRSLLNAAAPAVLLHAGTIAH